MSQTVYTINTKPTKPAPSKAPKSPKKSTSLSWDTIQKKLNRPSTYIALAVLLLLSVAFYFWWNRLPSLKSSPDVLARFEASDRFKNLPPEQQKPYYDAFRAVSWEDRRKVIDSMSDAQREALFANTEALNPRNHGREDFVKQFNAIHTAAGKRALIVAMMNKWQANQPTSQPTGGPGGPGNGGGGGRPGGGGPPGGGGRGGSPPPGDVQTGFREMREAMAEVRMENGLPSHR